MANEDYDPGGNSVAFGPGGQGGAAAPGGADDYDPGGTSKSILNTSYKRLPTAENGGGSLWEDLKSNIARNYATAGQPALPPDKIYSGDVGTGIGRGVQDFFDTGAHALASAVNKIPGVNVDVEGLIAKDKANRDAWEQLHGDSGWSSTGRAGGQILASMPVLGGVGSLIGRGAAMVPAGVKAAVQFLTSAKPAADTIGRGVQLALQGAGTGALQSALTSASSDEPVDKQILTGATVGGIGGPVLGGLTKAVDVLRGYSASVRPEIAALADEARKMGANIPMQSLSSNPMLRNFADVGSKLPFSGADQAALAARRKLQGVVAGTMGGAGDTFGPAEFGAIRDQIKKGYTDTLAQIPKISGGEPLLADLSATGARASQLLDKDTAGHVGRAIRTVADNFRLGSIDPNAYQTLTASVASKGPLALIENGAPAGAQPFLAEIRQALRDRLIASSSPEIAAQLKALDGQYRAMKTIQPLVAKSTTGDIQLGGLQQRVISQSDKFDSSTGGKAYTGGGTLGTVGDIGKQFFGKLDDSGTAQRMQAFKFAERPLATAAGMIPGMAINYPLQAYMRRPTVTGRMIDTSLGGATPDIGRMMPLGLLGINAERD